MSRARALAVLGAAVMALAACDQKPKTADKGYDPKDFSGVYALTGGLVFDAESAVDPSTQSGKPGGNGQVFGVGPNARMNVPYKPEYQALYEKTLEDRKNLIDDDYISNCIPYGFPRVVGGSPGNIEFIVTPKQVWILHQYFQQIRRIYMDAEHKPAEERWPTYYGDSVGHWEGDTLVVDTVGVKEEAPMARSVPHSDQERITERIRLVAPDVLHDEITITDPKVLSRPWTFTYAYRRMPGYEMLEYVCEDNREYVDANGGTHLRLGGS